MIIENPDQLPAGQMRQHEQPTDWYIYFLWFLDEIVYIGQTINLHTRVETHRSTKTFDRYTYHLIKNTTRDQVLLIERVNINHYKPAYNDNSNGVIKRKKYCIQGKATKNSDLIMRGKLYAIHSGITKLFYDGEHLNQYCPNGVQLVHRKDGKIFDKYPYKANDVIYYDIEGDTCTIRIEPKPKPVAPQKKVYNDRLLRFETILNFGKYKGKSVDQIIGKDRSYILWVARDYWNTGIEETLKKNLRIP